MEWALSCDVECLLFPSNNESLRGIRTMSQKLTPTKKLKYTDKFVYRNIIDNNSSHLYVIL